MSRDRIAGTALAVCALLSDVAVAHHPTVMARTASEALPAIVRLGALDRTVHGSLIAICAVSLCGMTVFSLRRGATRLTSLAGLIAYGLGTLTIVGAAVLDGFAIPAIAERYVAAGAEGLQAASGLLAFCSIAIQVLTKIGFVLTAGAALAWSIGLVRDSGFARIAGFTGFAYGMASTGLIFTGGALTPRTLLPLVVLQTVWYCTFAALLMRTDTKKEDAPRTVRPPADSA